MRRIKLHTRINLWVISILIFAMCLLSSYVYLSLHSGISATYQEGINSYLDDLVHMLQMQHKQDQEKLKVSLRAAEFLLKEKKEEDDYRSFAIKINPIVNGQVTVYQHDNGGYKIIASSFDVADSNFTIGKFYSDSLPLIKSIENNEIETQYLNKNQKSYHTAYKSLINKELMISVTQISLGNKEIQNLVEETANFKNTYPIIIDYQGNVIYHPQLKDTNISHHPVFESFKSGKTQNIRYQLNDGKWNLVSAKFFEPYQMYVGINVVETDFFEDINNIRHTIYWGIGLALLFISIAIHLIFRPITNSIKKVVEAVGSMSKGENAVLISTQRRDEIGEIIDSVNTLMLGLNNTVHFSEEIGKGNLEVYFKPLSETDALGNSLLKMRESLSAAQNERNKRMIEDQKRNWSVQGIALFSEFLRQDNDDIEKLSHNIIVNLVKYLEANQGGLFLINNNDRDNTYIELISCFAYDRKKKMEKTLQMREGLIGRCIEEKSMIYMSDLPQNYLHITSGLGTENPRYLLIVPMKRDEEVLGAIEIASFYEIEPYKRDFLQLVAESIASTILTAKINTQTAELLEQSREQAEEMSAQEEEMRQTMEEMMANQEESSQKESIARCFVDAVNHSLIRADFDTDGGLLYANTRFLEIIGCKMKEAVGEPLTTFIDEDMSETFLKIAQGGQHYEGEICFKTPIKDMWLLGTFTCVKNEYGRPDKVLFLGIDIDIKKAEIDQLSEHQVLTISTYEEEINSMFEKWSEQLERIKN